MQPPTRSDATIIRVRLPDLLVFRRWFMKVPEMSKTCNVMGWQIIVDVI